VLTDRESGKMSEIVYSRYSVFAPVIANEGGVDFLPPGTDAWLYDKAKF
jgi:hypothetical protein